MSLLYNIGDCILNQLEGMIYCHDLSHFIIENGPPTPPTKTLLLLSQIITKCMHYKSMILCNFFSQKLQVIELFLYRRKLLMASPTAGWPQRLGNWLFLCFKFLSSKSPLIISHCSVGHLGSVVPILKFNSSLKRKAKNCQNVHNSWPWTWYSCKKTGKMKPCR